MAGPLLVFLAAPAVAGEGAGSNIDQPGPVAVPADEPRASFNVGFDVAMPRGAFARAKTPWPLGLSFAVLGRLRSLPIEVGPVVSLLSYQTSEYPRTADVLWDDGTTTREDVNVLRSQDVLELGGMARLIPRHGAVRPFLDVSLRLVLFKLDEVLSPVDNTTDVTDHGTLNDCDHCSARPTWAAEVGGGLAILLARAAAQNAPAPAWSLDLLLGAHWHHGGSTRYEIPGPERRSSSSDTDMVIFGAALALGRR